MAPITSFPCRYIEKGLDKAEDKLEFQDLKVMELHEEDAKGWKYGGEGATNIILVYHGHRPSFIGRVLQISKVSKFNGGIHVQSKKDSKPMLSEDERKLWREWPNMSLAYTSVALTHIYASEVMRPLLGKDHVDVGLLVFLTAEFLEVVNKDVVIKQSQWRQKDAKMDTTGGVALLIGDHSSFHTLAGKVQGLPQTISIEVKPKWGCLPTSTAIFEIKNISKYSPLDLFSGNIEGIHKALVALFETPQNNIRIFMKGEEIFGGLENDNETISLEEKLATIMSIAPEGERIPSFQRLVANALHESKVLDQLLSVQKLDAYDIEGAILAYNKFLGMTDDVDDITKEKFEESPYLDSNTTSNVVIGTIVSNDTHAETLALEEGKQIEDNQTWIKSLSWEESRSVVQGFLIAATAKDCSLMVTLRPLHNKHGTAFPLPSASLVTCPTTGQQYIFKINFIKLDIKRLEKMPFYHLLDQQTLNTYKACSKQHTSEQL